MEALVFFTRDQVRTMMKRDYIPDGPWFPMGAELPAVSLQEVMDDRLFRCGARTGSDPQSGAFFCGAMADFVAMVTVDKQNGFCAVCENHANRPPRRIRLALKSI